MRIRPRLTAALLATATVAASLGTGAFVGPAAASDTGLRYYGAQLHLLWNANTPANVEQELDLLADGHANSARLDVSWSSLQLTGPGVVDAAYVARLDAVVDGAQRRGIDLVLALHTTPCWASSAPDSLKLDCTGAYWDRGVTRYPPKDNADFAWAARWVAQRYVGRVAALELWNEPNLVIDGVTPLIADDQAATYAGMVKAAYPAVKQVAPALPVLAGSMSFADDVFLKALYGHGIKGFYDGISVHPYNEWRAPGAPHDPAWYKYDYVLGLEAIRRAMTAAGDSSPVWVTEVGWTDCTVGADRWCVTSEQQAAYVEQVVGLTAERFPWVRALILYGLRDKGSDRTETEHRFGMVDRDYNPKPALAAMGRAFAAREQAGVVSPTPLPTTEPTTAPTTAPTTEPTDPLSTAPTSPVLEAGVQVVSCPFAGSQLATVVLCSRPQVLTR